MTGQQQSISIAGKALFLVFLVCLLAFCFDSVPQKSFGNIPDASTALKENAVARKTRIVIKNITIEDPRIVVHIGGRKKSEESVLDQLPSTANGNITNGSAEIVLQGSRQTIIVRSGNITIRDFSSEHGGKVILSGEVNYELGDKNMTGLNGSATASLDITAFKPTLAGTGTLIAAIDRGSHGRFSFQHLSAKVPFSLGEDELTLKAAEFVIGELKDSSRKQTPEVKDVHLGGDILYSFKSGTVSTGSMKGSIPAGGFAGSLVAVLREPMNFKGSIATPSLDLAKITETVKAYLPPDYRTWSVLGKAAAQTDFSGSYARKALTIKGRQRVTVSGGGLSSQDGTKAAQGVQTDADITFGYASGPERLEFSMHSTLSGGEFLWGTYYADFSGDTAKADASGDFSFSGEKPFTFSAGTDLFGAGSVRVSGLGHIGEQNISIDAKDIALQKLSAIFFDAYLKQNIASLAGLGVAGSASLGVKIHRKSFQTDLSGLIAIDAASLTIPAQKVVISGLHLNLPFGLGYPKAMSSDEATRGLFEIKSAEKDRIRMHDVSIPILLSRNNLRMPEDAVIHVARGDVIITGFAADDILSPGRKISCGFRINNVNLRPIQRSFTLSPITGTISSYYPKVEYYRDALTADGSTKVAIFGGEIEMGDVSIERLFSASRKIDADISFKNINLEQATEKIAIGKITGIIQGSLRGFEMEYGQPTRFVLDIDSVDTSGVSQSISVEAIQNISIIGTGVGMSGVLNRGIMSFFKDYPYSRIGIQAKLENDAFTVRGKIRSGSKEYLVKRGFLRGVDVVNQNPDNKISFKDMQERLTRIFESRKAGGAPVVQ